MRVEVKLFAIVKQLAGADSVVVELPDGATVSDLRTAISAHQASLAEIIPHVMFAVNTEYVDDAAPIPADADVACIPPVSGG